MICQCNGWQVWDQCQQTPLLQSRCSDVWGLKGRLRAFISRLYEALEQSGARCVLRLSLKRWTQMRINHMKGMFCYVLSTLNLGVRVEWVVLSDALFCKYWIRVCLSTRHMGYTLTFLVILFYTRTVTFGRWHSTVIQSVVQYRYYIEFFEWVGIKLLISQSCF